MKRPSKRALVVLPIAVGACLFRCVDLGRRPMHNDEANQAVRAGRLLEDGAYRYDPREHHGPTLYYLSLPWAWATAGARMADATEATFRATPAAFGTALVLLVALMGDGLGTWGLAGSALLTAVSPAMVYYSRFYIQEPILVFFTLGALAAGWRYWRRPGPGWAVAFGFVVGMMHATKETCVIAWAAMLGACAAARAWDGAFPDPPAGSERRRLASGHLGLTVLTAGAVSGLLFSSFLTNPGGPVDSLRTYGAYLNRAVGATDHIHPWHFYLGMLAWGRHGRGPVWTEAVILGLAVSGLIAAIRGRGGDPVRRRFGRFVAAYAALMTAAYSVIPYKTPWCMMSFLHALILLAGYGVDAWVAALRSTRWRVVAAALLLAGCAHLGRQAHRASFRFAADPRNPYAYAQTSTDYLRLVRRIEDIAAVHPDGRDLLIQVIAHPHNAWPLPWSLRAFRSVGYWTNVGSAPAIPDVPLITSSPDLADALAPRLGDGYVMEHYGLRPGVLVTLYIRRDLWETFLKTRA